MQERSNRSTGTPSSIRTILPGGAIATLAIVLAIPILIGILATIPVGAAPSEPGIGVAAVSTVNGKVFDPTGATGVGGAYVVVAGPGGAIGLGLSVSNPPALVGQFAVPVTSLPDGTYVAVGIAPDGVPYANSLPVTFTVSGGTMTPSSLDIRLTDIQVSGSVVDPTGGAFTFPTTFNRDRPEVILAGQSLTGLIQAGARVAFTSEAGNFKFGGLTAGFTYNLYARAPFSGTASAFANSNPLAVPYFGVTPMTGLSLPLVAPTVSGTVVVPDGRIVPNAEAVLAPLGLDGTQAKDFLSSLFPGHLSLTNVRGELRFGTLMTDTNLLFVIPPLSGEFHEYVAPLPITVTQPAGAAPQWVGPITLTLPMITGTVRLPDGTAAAGVAVRLRPQSGAGGAVAVTNDQGRFRFPRVPDGSYQIEVNLSLGSPYSAPQPTQVVVSGGQATPSSVEILLTSPQIVGIVKNPEGGNVPYTGVSVRTAGGLTTLGTATDGQGTFRLGGLPDGTYSLQALAPPDSSYGKSLPLTVTVAAGVAAPANPVLTLTTAQISGTVYFPLGWSLTGTASIAAELRVPVPGAVAFLRTPDRRFQEVSIAGPTGRFAFGGLADGAYLLSAEPPHALDLSPAPVVTVTVQNGAADKRTHELTLGQPQVRGVLQTPEGVPVGRGFVTIQTQDRSYASAAPVDPLGRFRLGGLRDGNYLLEGQPMPGDPYMPSPPAPITVTNGIASPNEVTLRLSAPGLTGTVRTPDGSAPVTRTSVVLQGDDDRLRFAVGVNQHGQFGFGRVPDGAYALQAFPAPDTGFGPSQAERVTIAGGRADRSGVELRVTHPIITGTVRGPTGDTPIAEAFVSLRSRDERIRLGTGVNQQGRFGFGQVPDGEYVLEASGAPSTGLGPSSPVTLTVVNGVPSRTNVDLRLTTPVVTGTVVTPLGTGLANAAVQLHTPDFRVRRGSMTGQSGEFAIGGVPDGDYLAVAFPPPDSDFTASRPVSVSIRSQAPVSVRITVTLPSISGTVVGPTGQAVAHAGVNVYTRDRSVQRDTGTGEDGRFKVGGLPAGQYLVQAFPPAGTDLVPSAEMTVTVVADTLTDIGQIALGQVQVLGRLVGPDGRAVPHAGVVIFTADRSFHRSYGTDVGGRFRIGGLPAGSYLLEVHLPFDATGLIAPSPLTVQIPLANPDLGDIAFRTAPKSIVGTVSRNTGGTVAGALIFANRQSPPAFASALTDQSGGYRLDVGGGNWSVGVANDPRGAARDWIFDQPPAQVSFADNTTTEMRTVNFTVTVANAVVSGKIAMPDGSPPFSNTVFVSLRDQTGRGSGAPLAADGSFRIRVPAGTYRLDVRSTDSSLYVPTQPPITVGGGDAVDLGTITLRNRSSTISGVVADQAGNGVAGIDVRAWLAGGGDFVSTVSITDGIYSLSVISGTWEVQAQPRPESTYRPYGPPARVALGDAEQRTGVNLQVVATDATLTGRLLDAGLNLLDKANGFVYVLRGAGTDTRMVGGGPLRNGIYEIAIPSGSGYRVGVNFPPDSGYVAEEQPGVSVGTGETKRLDLTARAANATIAGSLRGTDGAVVQGVPGHVFAGSPFGHRDSWIDPATGTYSMSVVAGAWYLNAAVPDESGYTVRPAASNVVTATAGQIATFDVTVARADAAVVGSATDPSGTAIGGAWVWASTRPTSTAGGPPRFVAGDVTRGTGAFTLTLPAGDYEIRATLPRDRGYLEPAPVPVTLTTGSRVTANLQFRTPSLVISGTVTLTGTAHAAHVTAFARGGARAEAQAGANGQYSLAIAGNDTWFVRARSVENNVLYESSLLTVTVEAASVTGQNLAMTARATLPVAESVSFDASTMQTVVLGDGTRIVIPAGALAISGTVTVRAAPKGEIPFEASRRPIGLAYELTAVDENNQSIDQFLQSVSIILAYTDAQLSALGITAADLVPAYWDPDTGSWRPVENVVVDEAARTVTILSDHFTDFAIVNTQSTAPTTTTVEPTKFRQLLPIVNVKRSSGW
ncbi:MAG: carboxypeptidase regulatory-like domain-containing protein [Chloroflexi bacterium]|nr:carboxypeptidase regulatory-like domain-containing protein [Chloroflexota bacterium]